jgi:hypothetical protein
MPYTITIEVDAETARAYSNMSGEDQRKIQMLLGLWLRDWARNDVPTLDEVIEEAGRNARARGLTPEILDSLLKEA